VWDSIATHTRPYRERADPTETGLTLQREGEGEGEGEEGVSKTAPRDEYRNSNLFSFFCPFSVFPTFIRTSYEQAATLPTKFRTN
jgi:hypothetical protein